ncbi:MAG: hypothetical protein AAFR22_06710 [Chloroflexota bacterium]
MDSNTKAQMKEARDRIRGGHYDEARAILLYIRHPTAREWLEKLEQLDPSGSADSLAQRPTKRDSGLSPVAIGVLAVGVVVFVAAVVLMVTGTLSNLSGFSFNSEPAPATMLRFDHPQVAFSYPDTLQLQDASQHPDCDLPLECAAWLTDSRRDAHVLVSSITIPLQIIDYSSDELERALMRFVRDGVAGEEFISRGLVDVGEGRYEAIRREMYYPTGGYEVTYLITFEGRAYFVWYLASSERDLNRYMADAEMVANTLLIK